MTFTDYATAARMRDAIKTIVKDVLNEERPDYRYATVEAVDVDTNRAYVLYSGEVQSVPIRLGSHRPTIGDVVRVAGKINDRHVDDVVTGSGGGSPGDFKMTANPVQPGWLLCDGSLVSRTEYSGLFEAIGTTFGVGDGSTTFQLPDFRDRFPAGVGNSINLGQKGGQNAMPLHSHGAGNLANNHTHGSGNLANNHTHSDGNLSDTHSHSSGNIYAASHSHGDGNLVNNHSHGSGNLSINGQGSGANQALTRGSSGSGTGEMHVSGNRLILNAEINGNTAGSNSSSTTGTTSNSGNLNTGGTTAGSNSTAIVGNTGNSNAAATSGNTGGSSSAATTGNTGNAGSGNVSNENRPPYLGSYILIKA